MSVLLMICNKVPQGLEAARRDNERGEKKFFNITTLFFSHLFVKNLSVSEFLESEKAQSLLPN